MKVSDFILQTRVELQEKSEFWSDEEMLIKLQRSFVSLQYDLPFFTAKESLAMQSGQSDYYLLYTPLKNVNCTIDGAEYAYCETENFYSGDRSGHYTFEEDKLTLGFTPSVAGTIEIVYRYAKQIESMSCNISTPIIHNKALRLLFMSEIHEKPTRNTKERNLSIHYLKLYEAELKKLRIEKKMRPKNLHTNYQRI